MAVAIIGTFCVVAGTVAFLLVKIYKSEEEAHE